LIVLGGVGFAVWTSTSRTVAPTGCASTPPTPIQLNQVVQGELTTFHTRRAYELSLAQPTQVTIAATSSWDNFLELYLGSSGQIFLQDDDSGGGRNAMISAMLAAGTYTVVVRPFSNATGPFSLTVSGFSTTATTVPAYPYPYPQPPPQAYPPVMPGMPAQ
jgi:hypothetical protein